MKKWRGLGIVLVAAVLLELISAVQYYYMHGMLEEEMELRAETELTLKSIITRRTVENTERTLKSHIMQIKNNLDQPDSLSNILAWMIKYHPSLRGSGIAFVPHYYPQKGKLFEPYALRTDSGIEKVVTTEKDFDYTKDGFYRDIAIVKDNSWAGPYDDTYLHQRLISYAVPIYEGIGGDTIAAFGIDIDTKYFGDTLNSRHLFPSSFDLLLTEDGKLIAGPSNPMVKKDVENVVNIINDSTIAKKPIKNGRAKIAEFRDPVDNDKGYVIYGNLRGEPRWQVAVVCYDFEVFGALRKLRVLMLILMLTAFSVLGLIVWAFFRRDRQLQKAQLQQERIISELRVAHRIQAKMLPNTFPPFPDRKDIDLYGLLTPAREVGGDLFDFFIHNEKLFFCIGDVSGKGVPAAMVMSVTLSLFRSSSSLENDPSGIMHNLNQILCKNNDSNMFVTLFIGVLDLLTGRLSYCNAGHDKPIVLQNRKTEVQAIDAQPHLPVGVFHDMAYHTEECMLTAGTTLFLYTDGLTEAMNGKHQQFGLERIEKQLKTSIQQQQPQAQTLVQDMEKAVQQFVGGAEQNDDLTILVIRYTPQTH